MVHKNHPEARIHPGSGGPAKCRYRAVTLCAMESELPSTLRYLAGNQCGVVSRSQALRAGLTDGHDQVQAAERPVAPDASRGLCRPSPGCPAAARACGRRCYRRGRAPCSVTRLPLNCTELADKATNPIHVTVPHERHVLAVEGISLHRSGRAVEAMEQRSYPPRTRVEETVLDLTQTAKTFDDVCGWVTRAFARDLTDETRLSAAMTARTKLRWRADLNELIVAAAAGDHSVLEFRYRPGRGAGARAAGGGPAGAVHHAGRPPGPAGPRVRTLRRGHRARRAARPPARRPMAGQDQGQRRRRGREAVAAVRLVAG